MIETAVLFYLASAFSLFKQQKENLSLVSAILLSIALIAHALSFITMLENYQINFNFVNSSSMTLWWITIFFSFLFIKNNLKIIAIYLYLLVAILLFVFTFLPYPTKLINLDFALHIFLSILAYSFLFLAFFESIFLSIQERKIHNRQKTINLPALETMENLLFQLLNIGFILLTVSIISGFIFLDNLFAQHLVHKTFLSILSWMFFALIIVGHRVKGWRSQIVYKYIQLSFILLLLAYSGSKFILERLY
ncbi:CcsA-related protein [hydrothermal vent metagenome]|uniref:CcsA-related protein n=1 Tax=hydrothermal vent metagenome TaxID=652676 RepID=A0A1W1CEF2_9ZZZZ